MAFAKFQENRFRIEGEITENHAILVNLTVSIVTCFILHSNGVANVPMTFVANLPKLWRTFHSVANLPVANLPWGEPSCILIGSSSRSIIIGGPGQPACGAS